MSAIDKGLLLERAARRGRLAEAREKKAELQSAVDDAVRAFGKLLDAGINRDLVEEMASGLYDEAANTDNPLNIAIDDCGEWYDGVDLDEVNALLAKCRRKA